MVWQHKLLTNNFYCLGNYHGCSATFRTKRIYLTKSMLPLQQTMINCTEIDVLTHTDGKYPLSSLVDLSNTVGGGA